MDTSHYKQLLLKRQKELKELAATGREAAGTVELDQSKVGRLSRMDALQAQAISQERERRREHELLRIDGALRRLDNGDYGYCFECDEPIAEERLALDPTVTLCIECADRKETC